LGVYRHGRSILGGSSILGAAGHSTWTKLTTRSARAPVERPWRR
jgi:hypothetical protein